MSSGPPLSAGCAFLHGTDPCVPRQRSSSPFQGLGELVQAPRLGNWSPERGERDATGPNYRTNTLTIRSIPIRVVRAINGTAAAHAGRTAAHERKCRREQRGSQNAPNCSPRHVFQRHSSLRRFNTTDVFQRLACAVKNDLPRFRSLLIIYTDG
jgi:hypothetical protein